MDDRHENRAAASEEPSSAYRDALYSQAPAHGKAQYGYNLAQCYARASSPEEDKTPCADKKRCARGLVAAITVLTAVVLAVVILQTGSLFLSSRANAAGGEAPSREIYED